MKDLKTYFKLQRRMISKTRSRFLSVLVIIFIGTAFFSGLRLTPKVMNTGADAYLDQQKYADLTLIPTYGVTSEDIEAIKKIDGVKNAEGTYFFDALLTYQDIQDGVVVYSQSNTINVPYLVSGRLVENDGECVVDEQYRIANGYEIGDVIHLENDIFKKDLKIVGFVKDARYMIYYKRGTNQYGNGSTKGFLLLSENDAALFSKNKDLVELLGHDAFYNEVCIEVEGARELEVYSDTYDDLLNQIEADLDDLMTSRLAKSYETLIADKKALMKEPLKAYEEGLAEYEKGKAQFEVEIKKAEIALVDGRMQILEARGELLDAQGGFSNIDITGQISGLQEQLNELQKQLEDLKGQLDKQPELPDIEEPELPDLPEMPDLPDIPETDDIKGLIDTVNSAIEEMENQLAGFGELADGLMQLEAAKLTLDKAELELSLGEQELKLKKQETEEQLAEAKQKLDEAKIQLDEAQAKIDEIPKAEYYLLDQNMNEGVVSFREDAKRIGVIAEVFPLLFFLVAALVSLTTMTRMVEEQRSQSGTLRALGYSRSLVMMQYIAYALFATFIGAIFGIFIGAYIFPAIIYGLYTLMMYDVPIQMIYCLDTKIIIEAILIAVVVTLVATIASCAKELMSVPAILMRPKAPKLGKRIFLEKIDWLWKRLNFNQKVTMRNMFRYKKRFLMSVIGISGCTALMLTGFGIKYSITDMTVKQFNEIWLYDGSARLTEEYPFDRCEELKDHLKENGDIKELMLAKQENGKASGQTDKTIETSLIVPSNMKRLTNYFVLRDAYTHENLELSDDSVIITQKLAELLDVEVGDEVQFSWQGQDYRLPIGAIAENYIQHSIYISPTLYSDIFEKDYFINTAYFNINEDVKDIENTLGKQLMDLEEVYSVTFTNTIGGTFVTQMNSINIVVWVLIISAGLLAFVVLYNLTNININERLTEIATIKVLGFKDPEVNDYVFRENILLSILGTILGFFLGIYLHHYIMATVEVDYVMFVRTIRPISFVYAAGLTMLFTLMINRFMRRVLKAIDMVSSLKSVE